MHVFTHCACTHARAHVQTLLINSGDQSWHTLKVSWSSDLIWLRYWGVLPGNTFSNIRQTSSDRQTLLKVNKDTNFYTIHQSFTLFYILSFHILYMTNPISYIFYQGLTSYLACPSNHFFRIIIWQTWPYLTCILTHNLAYHTIIYIFKQIG